MKIPRGFPIRAVNGKLEVVVAHDGAGVNSRHQAVTEDFRKKLQKSLGEIIKKERGIDVAEPVINISLDQRGNELILSIDLDPQFFANEALAEKLIGHTIAAVLPEARGRQVRVTFSNPLVGKIILKLMDKNLLEVQIPSESLTLFTRENRAGELLEGTNLEARKFFDLVTGVAALQEEYISRTDLIGLIADHGYTTSKEIMAVYEDLGNLAAHREALEFTMQISAPGTRERTGRIAA